MIQFVMMSLSGSTKPVVMMLLRGPPKPCLIIIQFVMMPPSSSTKLKFVILSLDGPRKRAPHYDLIYNDVIDE